jgi:hypothetical protein
MQITGTIIYWRIWRNHRYMSSDWCEAENRLNCLIFLFDLKREKSSILSWGFVDTPAKSPATGYSWSTPIHWYLASMAVSYSVRVMLSGTTESEIATKRWLFIEFYDYTMFTTVLATCTERFAHWFCVFYPHSCQPIIPRALSRTPTYPTVLTIVHWDGTSILSLHNIYLYSHYQSTKSLIAE